MKDIDVIPVKFVVDGEEQFKTDYHIGANAFSASPDVMDKIDRLGLKGISLQCPTIRARSVLVMKHETGNLLRGAESDMI